MLRILFAQPYFRHQQQRHMLRPGCEGGEQDIRNRLLSFNHAHLVTSSNYIQGCDTLFRHTKCRNLKLLFCRQRNLMRNKRKGPKGAREIVYTCSSEKHKRKLMANKLFRLMWFISSGANINANSPTEI